jgi:hypothetical protein
MRGRNRPKGPNPLTRSYESNGPDVKIRGTAQHIADKYAQLARDAQASGDPVAAENYFQHAEHYYRIIATAQEALRQQFGYQQRPFDEDGEDGDEESFGYGQGGDRQGPARSRSHSTHARAVSSSPGSIGPTARIAATVRTSASTAATGSSAATVRIAASASTAGTGRTAAGIASSGRPARTSTTARHARSALIARIASPIVRSALTVKSAPSARIGRSSAASGRRARRPRARP